jgi:hypothetical protein
MPADVYLTTDELVALTEFDYVKGKATPLLDFYVDRAHIRAVNYGPFPTVDSIADPDEKARFQADMKVALFLIAEGMVLANPARPMESAGITQEKAAQLNLSRAEGGGRSGKAKATNTVPEEALDIFHRWALGTLELLKAQRTDVFEPTHSYDVNDPNRKLVTREDIDDLSLELHPRPGGAGGQLFDADQ